MQAYFVDRLPLFYVLLSGIGFSLQALTVKLLVQSNFHAIFQCVFVRGIVQFVLAGAFVLLDRNRLAGIGPSLFGDSAFVRCMLFMRAVTGFGGIAFAFLSVELISMGDAAVLTKLSPMLAAMASYFILGEPWHIAELCATVIALAGAVMVARPSIIFGGNEARGEQFFAGVVYAVISAISAAFAYVFVRILGTTAKMPWANVCFSQAIGQMVLSIPCLYIFGQKLNFGITGYQLGMLVLGGFIGAVSQIWMTIGMQREKSAAATAMRMSDVAFGFLWQVLFTPDKLSLLSLGGAVLVTCSILIIVAFKQPNTPSVEQGTHDAVQLQSLSRKKDVVELVSGVDELNAHLSGSRDVLATDELGPLLCNTSHALYSSTSNSNLTYLSPRGSP